MSGHFWAELTFRDLKSWVCTGNSLDDCLAMHDLFLAGTRVFPPAALLCGAQRGRAGAMLILRETFLRGVEWRLLLSLVVFVCACVLSFVCLQGYLAHNKIRPPGFYGRTVTRALWGS